MNKTPFHKLLNRLLHDESSKLFLSSKRELLQTLKKLKREKTGNGELIGRLEEYSNSELERYVNKHWTSIVGIEENQDVHAPRKLKIFTTLQYTTADSPGIQFQADTVEMKWLLDKQDDERVKYLYLLLIVDVYSGRIYLYPMKSKKGTEYAETIDDFFKNKLKNRKGVLYFQTDRGTEFYNKNVKAVFSENNAVHYSTHTPQKSFVAERKIRDVKHVFSRTVANYNRNGKKLNIENFISIVENKINNRKNATDGLSPMEKEELTDYRAYDSDSEDDFEEDPSKHLKKAKAIRNSFISFMRKESKRNKRIKKLYSEQMKSNRLPLKNPLKVGTRVYITTYREKGYTHENNFVKKTQRLKNSWNTDKVYVVSKMIKKTRRWIQRCGIRLQDQRTER